MLILLDNLSFTKHLQQCCSPQIHECLSTHSVILQKALTSLKSQWLSHAAQGSDWLFIALISVYVQIKCKDPLSESWAMSLQGNKWAITEWLPGVSLLWGLWAIQVVRSNQGALCSGYKGLPPPCTPDTILALWGLCNRPAGSPCSPSAFIPQD